MRTVCIEGASPLAATNPDAELVSAWEQYRALNLEGYRTPLSDEEHYQSILAKTVLVDRTLFDTTPTTIEGVNAVLRRITPIIEGTRWLDRAIANDDDETLAERLDDLDSPHGELVRCIIALGRLTKGGE